MCGVILILYNVNVYQQCMYYIFVVASLISVVLYYCIFFCQNWMTPEKHNANPCSILSSIFSSKILSIHLWDHREGQTG